MKAAFGKVVTLGVLSTLIAFSASALEVGQSHFAFVSELAAEGYEPFASSSTGKALFGMKKGNTMFLCFSADAQTLQAERRETLLAHMQGRSTDRLMPNIVVACVLIQ